MADKTAHRARRALVAAIALLALAALALAYAALVEPRWIAVTRHTVGKPSSHSKPLRILQLSDLHLRGVGARERRIAEIVAAEKPDLVVFTGDLIDSREGLAAADAFLALLPPGGGVASLGNWEHWSGVPPTELGTVLAKHRVALVVNGWVARTHEGKRYRVAALDDATAGRPNAAKALGGDLERNVAVLAHSPEWRDAGGVPPGIDLILSGHTHGGQVTFFGLAPFVPNGSGRYRAGWYRGEPADLYVSRGVGTSILPLRFFARPEVAVFEWWLE